MLCMTTDLQENTHVSAFHNFRIKILHGDKDNVIPWTMGFELFNTVATLKKQLSLKTPISVSLVRAFPAHTSFQTA